MRKSRSGGIVLALVIGALALTGCTSGPTAAPTAAPTDAVASVSPTPGPSSTAPAVEVPTLLPGGTALANRAYFDYVNNKLFVTNPKAGSQAIVDNLVAAGFDKSSLQVTPDKTAVLGLAADSIEFSVLVFDQCLIGQFSSHGYHSTIGPVVSPGVCLAGKTATVG